MRRTTHIKVVAVLAAAAMAMLAGCSSSGDDSGATTAPPSTSEADGPEDPDQEEAPPAETGEAVAVTFWQRQFTDQEDAWYKDQVDAFNASQSEVVVDYQMVPEDAWDQKMTAAQAAGTAPDVYTRAYNQIPTLVGQQAIKDLSALIPQESWDDLEPNILDMVSVEGAHYAYPVLVEPSMVLFYRTDLFEEAGLDPTKPPTTFDELIDYGSQLKDILPDGTFALGLAEVASEMGWTTWGLQNGLAGHLPLSADYSTAEAEDPAYAPLFDLYRDLYSNGILPKQALAPYVDSTPFGEGKLAMMACGSWASGEIINNFPDLVENTAVAKMPLAENDPTSSSATLGGWSVVVDGKTTKDQAAADFINYLLAGDPAALIDYFKLTQFSKFPARQSVNEALNADPAAASANPFRQKIAEEIVPTSIPEAIYPYDIALAFTEEVEAAMQGKDTASAQADAQQKITDLIAQLGIAGTGPGA
ncbi:MAG: extracellular solute-binding protein [Bifidobacteriaceae bacterium]|jgi:multiple sugar transport system substrate-binding protein|nr:extracellular solute-binding protein [Bifidobacteriaceae bacterium]